MQITDYMGVVFPLVGLPLLDCYHFDGFEGNANISVAIKSGSTVITTCHKTYITTARYSHCQISYAVTNLGRRGQLTTRQ